MRRLTLTLSLLITQHLVAQDAIGRESITFILGDSGSGMYALAQGFHESRGDRVITSVRSFQGVRDYLERFRPVNSQPWGRVELVLHGNGKGQTDTPLLEGGSITTTALLAETLDRGEFPPLPDQILDQHSEIRLHGCALGQDEAFLGLFSRAFGGADEQRPLISASRLYTCYRSASDQILRYFSRAWSLVFPAGPKPDPEAIASRLRQLDPDCDADIIDALNRDSARFPGDTYVEAKPLRFQWKVAFERVEERPSPGTALAWLRRQADLADRLKEQGLSFENLAWKTSVSRESIHGRMYPILVVEGSGQAFHLLRTQKDPDLSWDDPKVCARVR